MYSARRKQSNPDPAIAFLARESQVPIDDVARLYGNELARLKVGARIHGFLAIFAFRKVREMLRQRSAGKQPPAQAARPGMDKTNPQSPQGTEPEARLQPRRALPAKRPRLNWTGDAFLL